MLKPIAPDAQTTTISLLDPAIDWEASFPGMNSKQASDELSKRISGEPSNWRDALKLRPGCSPVVFRIGVLDPMELCRIEDECKISEKDGGRLNEAFFRCFLLGVRGIDGLSGESIPTRKNSQGVEYVDPEWLASRFIGGLRKAAIGIGCTIYQWNQLDELTVKN